MSQMHNSRFGKQIEICQCIKSIKNESQMMIFLQVWSQQLNCKDVQQLLSKLFISTKCELSDTANNVILASFDKRAEENNFKSRIELLPKDIFNNLASFLNKCDVFVLSSDKVTASNNIHNTHTCDWNCSDNECNSKCTFCKWIALVCSQTKYDYTLS